MSFYAVIWVCALGTNPSNSACTAYESYATYSTAIGCQMSATQDRMALDKLLIPRGLESYVACMRRVMA